MKAISQLFIVVFAIFLFSCDNATEEITINADGSGEYKLYTDAVGATRTVSLRMATMFAGDDVDIDSLKEAVEEKIWSDFSEEVDSILDYSDKVPDEIKNDPEKMKIVNKMQGFMKGSRKEGFINTGIRYPFENMDDLQAFMKVLEENQKQGSKAGTPVAGITSGETEVDYQFQKKSFSRTTKIIKKPEVSPNELNMLKMMMPEGTMKTVIHLPKPAKTVKGNHKLEDNGKTVVFEYDILKVLMGEASNDFSIDMK